MTTATAADWTEVTRTAPCPICGKPDWCGRAGDDAVRCMRVAEAPTGWEWVKAHADGGCTFKPADLHRANGKATRGRIAQTYPYVDEQGELLYEVVRFEPKDFRQRRPDGNGGWAWSLKGIRRVLYRLPDVRAAGADAFVFVVEGEKDADRLAGEGLVTTTCPQGAGKWHHVDDEPLRGRHVVLLPDRDQQGQRHAQDVAHRLSGKAASVRVLEMPDLPEKGDVSDWLDAGHDAADLVTLAEAAPEWQGMVNPSAGGQASHLANDGKHEAQRDGRPILDPADPMATARRLIGSRYTTAAGTTLMHHAGDFREHDGAAYRLADDATMRARAWEYLEHALRIEGRGDQQAVRPFQPKKRGVDDVMDALKAAANLPATIAPPAWLHDGEHAPAAEFLPFRNGLLHLPTLTLHEPTPQFFTLNALGFDYKPDAPEPSRWLDFLSELWPEDQTAIDTLQEVCGYLLTQDTTQEKIFLLVGPKRSGKGTIGRVLRRLVGEANVCGPTLSGLSQPFGLQPLIGSQLAIIGDVRLSGRADQAVIAERLLSISGEDALSIPRKHRPDWTGRLTTRFLLLTNELPRLADASGALASRFVVLALDRSFYGREDTRLTAKLLEELPGILNWALEGWRRLQRRGHFVQPTSSADAIEELDALGSPVGAFVRERCTIEPGRSVEAQTLYAAWCDWCKHEGREHPGTAQTFGRDLKAAVPSVRTSRPRVGGTRLRWYEGIDLRGAEHGD